MQGDDKDNLVNGRFQILPRAKPPRRKGFKIFLFLCDLASLRENLINF